MLHLKIEHILGTVKPTVCFRLAFQTHFHIGRAILGWHTGSISQPAVTFTVTLRSLCRNVSGYKHIGDLRRFGSALQMLIWATRVRNLGWKSPKNNHSHEISNPSCFWQNLKFRGNGSCRKTSVWCWPAPGRRAARGRKPKPMWLHVFTPFQRFGFGSHRERALGIFYFVPAPSNAIHLTHEALNIRRKQRSE